MSCANSTEKAIIDQQRRVLTADHKDFQGVFSVSSKKTLKSLHKSLCPHYISAFMVQQLSWSKSSEQ